jgi:hypothetical protein
MKMMQFDLKGLKSFSLQQCPSEGEHMIVFKGSLQLQAYVPLQDPSPNKILELL